MCSPQIHRSRHTLLLRRRPLNDRLTSIRFAFVEPSACSLLLWLARVEPRTRIGLNGILLSNLWILSSLLFSVGIRLLRINLANRSSLPFLLFFTTKGEEGRKRILDLEFRFGNLYPRERVARSGIRASLLQLSRLIFIRSHEAELTRLL